ncbi:MAG TPA: DJ-1/PfpI family protein [Gammaproteobacteria bacterium]|nr:DJ-1/PfpI family protein [Gammaproteobacteria bacterium]
MKIAFLFYDGMTALDAVGPHEILCRLPNAKVYRVAKNAGSIQTDSGLVLMAEYGLADVNQADILFLPGAGSATTLKQYPEILEWVRNIHKTTTWTTSVCTGSLILGAAGLLKGLSATTHWAALDRLAIFGAHPKQSRIVESGKIMTAAGVSAGIDMALTLAAKIAGKTVAETLQLGIEYDPEPPFDAGSPAKANPDIRENLRKRLVSLFESIGVIHD